MGRQQAGYEEDERRWSTLMVAAQDGCERSYRALLEEVSVAVERYLLARFGRRAFIDDCVQDVLMAIHEGRHTYAPGRPFRAWLFAIVRHKAIDSLRRQQRDNRWIEAQQSDEALAQPAVEQPMETSILGGRLLQALAEPYREAVTMTKIMGFTNREVASRLSISESAVKVRVHRGLTRLQKMMELDAP